MAFIGCADARGTTSPAPDSVIISDVSAASESISFTVMNPNAEAVKVTIALDPALEAARVAVDGGEPSALAGSSIDFTSSGADGDRKNIRITGLANGTPYTVTLTTADTAGHSQEQKATGSATPLAPPDATTLTAAAGDGSVILRWSASDGDSTTSGYRVYRVTESGEFVLLTTDPATLPTGTLTYTDTSAVNGTEYRYRLRAVNDNGTETDSNTASATPLAPPSAPTLTVDPGNMMVALTWTAPTGGGAVSGYRIYRAVGSGTFERLTTSPATLAATTLTYTDMNLTNATAYGYRVRAVNANDAESGDSNTAMKSAYFYLHTNGVTIVCAGAADGATGVIRGDIYTKRTRGGTHAITASNAARSCTSGITDMNQLFRNNTSFDVDINHWDTSRVENMSGMFWNTTMFNQNIGSWNVAAVTNMSSMFNGASNFNNNSNPDIGRWNVAAVENMSNMFNGATRFDQNIGRWNVAAVENMSFMFNSATAFNQDISSWKVGAVTNMQSMFSNASDFNQNIGGWNVAAVTDMVAMFGGAEDFNQNLSGWRPLCITSKPTNFDTRTASGFVGVASRQPTWATAPLPQSCSS